MWKKYFLLPALLGCAGLLMAPDISLAQHGHGGGHGGGHVSGGHVSAGHGGGYHGGGYHGGGYYGRGFYGGGYYGGFYPLYGGWGGYWPGYYTYPYYADTYSPDYSVPAYPYPTTYPTDNAVQPASNIANVRVIVPDPQARVWFDGTLMTQTGSDRLYNTPALSPGSTYSYKVRATWMENGHEMSQEQSVSVAPGQTKVVDFAHVSTESFTSH
jgi:uncharacterized protein (TIGR03000 family)